MDDLERIIRIRRYLIIAAVVVAIGGAAWLGWYLRGNHDEQTNAKLEEQLTECELMQQEAIRDGQNAAGWVALADKQLGESEKEKQQIKEHYEDSLRVIRAMLPDDAERAIADYYNRQQATGRYSRQ